MVDSGGHGKAVDLGDQARREGPRRHANPAYGAGMRSLRQVQGRLLHGHREAEHPRPAQVRGRVHQHQITG